MRGALLGCLAALLALSGALAGCGQDGSAEREGETAIRKAPGREPVLGIAEPNAWRRVPPLASTGETARLVAEAGADSQRFVVDWAVAEPQAPRGEHRYDFSAFDPMYRAALDRGQRPLLVALSAPAWAADPGTTPGSGAHNPPAEARLADWAAFLGAVARRYPGALGIEIWNEPNLEVFWGAGSNAIRPDPARYARLLATAYDAVKAVDPSLLVVGGALAPGADSPAGDRSAEDFARVVLASGGAEHMDALSLHPYPGAGGVPEALARIEAVRAVRDDAGARTPLWLTEVGVTTSGPNAVSEERQAHELVAICRAVSRQPDVDALYVHTLVERPGPPTSPEPGFGLVRILPGGDLEAKPSFGAVREVFSAPGGC